MDILIKTICRVCIFLILLATAAEAAQSDLARQMLKETNLARTQPRRYAGYLQNLRRQYSEKNSQMHGSPELALTSEGVAAIDEAIEYLTHQHSLPPLAWSQGLADAAADLVRDQGQTGEVGHIGTSGDTLERIERHGSWDKRISENIGYGPNTARRMVMELIIDDGVPERGHRKNIFTRSFSVAGAACGPHPVYQNMCAMTFAVRFKPHGKR